MPRINIDDTLRNDPRFEKLAQEIGKPMAFGTLICLWDLGMSYWKKSKSLIPKHVFYNIDLASTLLRLGFVELRDEFVYCNGSEDNWGFLLSTSERGKVGGVASAKARKEKYGSSQPQKLKKQPKKSKPVEANRNTLPLPNPLPNPLPAISTDLKSCDPDKKSGHASPTSKVKNMFQESYKQVYGYEIHWGARENGQISNWLKSVPIDDALQIAKLYPFWKEPYIADKAHPLGLMVTNTSKIMAYIKNPTEHVLRVLNAKDDKANLITNSKKELHDAQYQHALRRLEDSTKTTQQAISNAGQGRLLERSSQHFGDDEHESPGLE